MTQGARAATTMVHIDFADSTGLCCPQGMISVACSTGTAIDEKSLKTQACFKINSVMPDLLRNFGQSATWSGDVAIYANPRAQVWSRLSGQPSMSDQASPVIVVRCDILLSTLT